VALESDRCWALALPVKMQIKRSSPVMGKKLNFLNEVLIEKELERDLVDFIVQS